MRLIDETDADIATIAMAYVAVTRRYGLSGSMTRSTRSTPASTGRLQLGLYAAVQDLLLSRMVWFVRNVDFKDGLEAVIARFGPGIREIAAALDTTLPPDLQAARAKRRRTSSMPACRPALPASSPISTLWSRHPTS